MVEITKRYSLSSQYLLFHATCWPCSAAQPVSLDNVIGLPGQLETEKTALAECCQQCDTKDEIYDPVTGSLQCQVFQGVCRQKEVGRGGGGGGARLEIRDHWWRSHVAVLPTTSVECNLRLTTDTNAYIYNCTRFDLLSKRTLIF